jgi:hypothetical protein
MPIRYRSLPTQQFGYLALSRTLEERVSATSLAVRRSADRVSHDLPLTLDRPDTMTAPAATASETSVARSLALIDQNSSHFEQYASSGYPPPSSLSKELRSYPG